MLSPKKRLATNLLVEIHSKKLAYIWLTHAITTKSKTENLFSLLHIRVQNLILALDTSHDDDLLSRRAYHFKLVSKDRAPHFIPLAHPWYQAMIPCSFQRHPTQPFSQTNLRLA